MRRIKIAAGASCVIVLTAAGISPVSAQMLDRAGKLCGQAIVTAKFQQEDKKREVDVEVYSTARGERWRIEMRAANPLFGGFRFSDSTLASNRIYPILEHEPKGQS